MDVEKIYPIGSRDNTPYKAIIGWSDTQQDYYACIQADTETEDITWRYWPTRGVDASVIMNITASVVEAWTGESDQLEPTLETIQADIQALNDAPNQRQVDPSEIVRVDMLDTDWVRQVQIENAVARELERNVCIEYLDYCVDVLAGVQRRENNQESYSIESFDERRSTIMAQTVASMVEHAGVLNDVISEASALNLASGDYTQLWSLESMLTAEDMATIDQYTQSICGTALSAFPTAVSRGYNPTNGTHINGLSSIDKFVDAHGFSAFTLWPHHGEVPPEDRERFDNIILADPRNRSEEDWQFVDAVIEQLALRAQEIEADARLP